jgi:hypothetical protein
MLLTFAPCWPTIINIPVDWPTIQQGIDASVDGDTVLVHPGTYVENINFNGHNIVLASLFMITGDTNYISQTIVDGASASSVIKIDYCDTLTAVIGLSIRNGYASRGGGIFLLESNSRIIRNFIYQNSATYGGGIACEDLSSPIIAFNIIEQNSATRLGGGIYCHDFCDPEISSNIVRENSAGLNGGGFCYNFYCGGQANNNLITDNTAVWNGGGVCFGSHTNPTMRNNLIARNSGRSGGGVYSDAYYLPRLYENEITENVALYYGGGIYLEDDGVIIGGNIITYNEADYGGGIYTLGDARPEIEENTIAYNTAYEGAGIFCDSLSEPTIISNIISENTASGFGGGIRIKDNNEATIEYNEIASNHAATGGGIFSVRANALSISHNLIADNIGGGIKVYYYEANIIGNIISGNTNSGLGGGMFFVGNHSILNNVIYDNVASKGGAIYAVNSNSPIRNNVFYLNSASWGGALYCVNSNPNITNSIFWADSAANGDEIYVESGTPEVKYCDIQGGYPGQGNINLDPFFRDPATEDFHLMSTEYGYPHNSPCIDAGNPADLDSLLSEFWGLGTVYCDMGAFGGGARQGSIIYIPDDYPTIQQGIDAGDQNDTILVHPGIYTENIRIEEVQLFVGSLFLTTGDTSFISLTVIDGDSSGPVFRFIDCEHRSVSLTGFTVRNGRSYAGGGIHCDDSSPDISFNRITGNLSSDGGGGIYCERSEPVIYNNIIDGNYEDGYWGGGGIFCYNSDALIFNNLVVKNTSTSRGGAFSFLNSDPVIINNTVTGNLADRGGGIYNGGSYPTIINTIFWADSAITDSNEIYIYSGSMNVSYCDVQGGWPGSGNINLDPLFRDTANGNFHLMSIACDDPHDSPCIDEGDPGLFDSVLDCALGLGDWRSDIGAYGGRDSVMTSISEGQTAAPCNFLMAQNFPNPFNVHTVIEFALPSSQDVRLTLYDLLGRRVRVLLDEYRDAGTHRIVFDATGFASGIYFYRLRAGEIVETKRMLLLK